MHPNAQEECDGIDNNCDTLIDDNSAVNQPTWYIDGDTDGFGDASVSTTSCNSPLGYVANDTDCDDGDGTIQPDATKYGMTVSIRIAAEGLTLIKTRTAGCSMIQRIPTVMM